MAAKVHKSLRLDETLINRVEALKADTEPVSNTFVRVLEAGCDALERGTDTAETWHDVAQPAADGGTPDDTAQKMIELLQADRDRLIAEHEQDKAVIAEKDRLIAQALDRAQTLASQAHLLVGATHNAKADDDTPKTDIIDLDPPKPRKISFMDWWRNYR